MRVEREEIEMGYDTTEIKIQGNKLELEYNKAQRNPGLKPMTACSCGAASSSILPPMSYSVSMLLTDSALIGAWYI